MVSRFLVSVPEEDILRGSPLRVTMQLAWPVMLASLLQTAYHMADTFWLGRLAVGASAAVAGLQAAQPFLWFSVSFAMGLSVAATALVAQAIGAGERRVAGHAAGQILGMLAVLAVICVGLAQIMIPLYLGHMQVSRAVQEATEVYLRLGVFSLPGLFMVGLFRTVMAASGDTLAPLKIALAANLFNMGLDPLLIFGWGPIPAMGVAGAAWATVVGTSLAGGWALFGLMGPTARKSARVRVFFRDLVPDWAVWKRVSRIGLPAAFGMSIESFGFVVMMLVLGLLADGDVALAAYGVGERWLSLITISIMGVGDGLATLIGQNVGARQMQRATLIARNGIRLLFGVVVIKVVLVVIFRHQLIAFFVPDSPKIIEEGGRFLLIFGSSVPLFGIVQGVRASFNAIGNNIPPLLTGLCRLWILRVPLSVLFGVLLGYGAPGVWVGMALSNLGAAILASIFFFHLVVKSMVSPSGERVVVAG